MILVDVYTIRYIYNGGHINQDLGINLIPMILFLLLAIHECKNKNIDIVMLIIYISGVIINLMCILKLLHIF